MTTPPDPAARLAVALDVPSVNDALRLIDRIGLDHITYKIGLELLYADGMTLARRLAAEGRSVFVDAKLLDIPNTVERATAQIADSGAAYLTLHAHDRKTVTAAVKGRAGSSLKLLGVTVLTSTSEDDLRDQGFSQSVGEMVLRRARMGVECGLDGVVAAPHELQALRSQLGNRAKLVTPGIRLAQSVDGDDQARVAGPADAITSGADMIVVGRPITKAPDPAMAARAIIAEIANAAAKL
jgi:orotidine-5'-phosphate decarboxylase